MFSRQNFEILRNWTWRPEFRLVPRPVKFLLKKVTVPKKRNRYFFVQFLRSVPNPCLRTIFLHGKPWRKKGPHLQKNLLFKHLLISWQDVVAREWPSNTKRILYFLLLSISYIQKEGAFHHTPLSENWCFTEVTFLYLTWGVTFFFIAP